MKKISHFIDGKIYSDSESRTGPILIRIGPVLDSLSLYIFPSIKWLIFFMKLLLYYIRKLHQPFFLCNLLFLKWEKYYHLKILNYWLLKLHRFRLQLNQLDGKRERDRLIKRENVRVCIPRYLQIPRNTNTYIFSFNQTVSLSLSI